MILEFCNILQLLPVCSLPPTFSLGISSCLSPSLAVGVEILCVFVFIYRQEENKIHTRSSSQSLRYLNTSWMSHTLTFYIHARWASPLKCELCVCFRILLQSSGPDASDNRKRTRTSLPANSVGGRLVAMSPMSRPREFKLLLSLTAVHDLCES